MAESRKKTPVSIRVNAVLLNRLLAIGEPDGWNRSDMIERAIEFYVNHHQQGQQQSHQQKPARGH